MAKSYPVFVSLLVASALTLSISACGGDNNTPAPPEATVNAPDAAASPAVQAESPLAAVSPLEQPASPLSLPPAVEADGRPLHDVEAIRQIAAANTPVEPQPGMASFSALLFSNSIGSVIPGTLAYFTPAIEDNGRLYPPNGFTGPNREAGDVAVYSDEYGRINVDNVPPGNYVLAVWTVYDYVIIEDPNTPDYPRIFEIKAGDKLDLGMLTLSWP